MDPRAEWLEADGLGGFASGTLSGIRTRRYHALLLTASTPPTGRMLLVNGLDAWVEGVWGKLALSSQAYLPDVVEPDGASRLVNFAHELWPHWTWHLPDGSKIEQELCVPKGRSLTAVSWRSAGPRKPQSPLLLHVRPFLSGRDYHALHHENPNFRFTCEQRAACLCFQPYPDVAAVFIRSNASYRHEPLWYRNFRYDEERARGLDFTEDLASPGVFTFDLAADDAVWLLAAEGYEEALGSEQENPVQVLARLHSAERERRSAFTSALERAADTYLVRRDGGHTIIAGYPWFTDWGRDTMIALRGLCLATDRLEVAREILLQWCEVVSEGMLPNHFPDAGTAPKFNSVDAPLWYVVAVHELFEATDARGLLTASQRNQLLQSVAAILESYVQGTRYGIRLDRDGLLAAGEAGVQLTWMDAKVGDWIVTPRIGKPVEVEALWANALALAARENPAWSELARRAARAFGERFWYAEGAFLYDVVDVDHRPGAVDAAFRPNQIFAVGGLPLSLLAGERAQRIVAAVEERLWTPLGLRSLAPGEPGYSPHYTGGVRERDAAYHQGTVWPWLIGPFVEAWLRVRGSTQAARAEARRRFLAPLYTHLGEAGLGHISEIVDAEAPHVPRGCPFQAWSLGELLRLEHRVLADSARPDDS